MSLQFSVQKLVTRTDDLEDNNRWRRLEMTSTKPQINSLHDQTIQATIADPEYTDALINVEIELDASINPTDLEPVFGLNFVHHTDKGKILLESRDVYLSVSNFQYLSFSSAVLFTMVLKELSSKLNIDKAEIIDQAKYVIEQLSELVNHLEAKNGTYR
jgi:hypothetical protein